MTPLVASVVHATARRVRLRIPDLRGDAAGLESVADAYRATGAVARVRTNPQTATVLLDGLDVSAAGRPAWLEEHGGLRLATGAVTGPERPVLFDDRLVPAILTVLAAVQAVRGRLLSPALTLLLQAHQLRTAGGRRGPRPEDPAVPGRRRNECEGAS